MISLAQLDEGKSAEVLSIEGGRGAVTKLHNLGIREGVVVRKVTGVFRQGPIVVKAGNTQIALGVGMASKVIVKPL